MSVEFDRPKVKYATPIGQMGVVPVPKHLDAESISEQQELFIYTPFLPGLSVKSVPAQNITYSLLSQGFIVEGDGIIEKEPLGPEQRNKQQMLSRVAETFWPVAQSTFHRLLSVPKRDNGLHNRITPDMTLTVSPPKRKIQGPKNTRKPGKPKLGSAGGV